MILSLRDAVRDTAQAEQSIRSRLREPDLDAERVVSIGHSLLRYRESLRLLRYVLDCVANAGDRDPHALVEAVVLQTLLRSADDTMSGRFNDSRRVAHDAIIEVCRDLTHWAKQKGQL